MQRSVTPAPVPDASAPLRIGVTGGTGFVGRAIVTQLAGSGHRVRIATRSASHADALLPLSSVEIHAGDVHQPRFLRSVFDGCDAVIHLVGILNERGFGGAGFRRAHVGLTASVLEAMRETQVPRLLHMSALHADPSGRSYYLRTKGEAEALVRGTKGLKWTLFRPSVIFGAQDSLTRRFAGLLKIGMGWLPLARAGARFAPIHVRDVAQAFVGSLGNDATVGRTFELCGPQVLTLEQLVREVARAAKLPCHIVAVPDALAWLQAGLMELIPGKPFSLDNMRSLMTDSVCGDCGCAQLGIQPDTLTAWLPQWLAPRTSPRTGQPAPPDRA